MIKVESYDRSHALSADELHHMQILVTRFQEGGKGWHKTARPALQRLLRPLEAVLDHLGAVNTVKRKYTIRATVICLLIRAMVRYERSFWAFSTDIWFELLGTDYYAYVRVHGMTANARQQLIAVAYLFCGFQELGCLGRLAFPALARKVFGTDAFDNVINEMTADLMTWGYTRTGNIVGLRCALAEAMLASRSLCLSDLQADTLDRLYREADAKITRRGLTILSYVLVRRGLLQKPLGRDGQNERKESIAHRRVLNGVPVIWRKWCERWFATTTLQHSSRISVLYRLFNAGRWLAHTGYGLEPADWNREIAASYVAAVDRSTIGQWSTGAAPPASRIGQPLKPASKASALTAMRQFFRDCQEWGWIPVRFNPFQALATPRSVRCLIGPDPRIIQDAVWAKLLWAGLNLTDRELSKPDDPEARGDGHFYPATLVKALVLVWLFSGLRRNEIARLRIGCIRWESGEEKPNEHPVCFLHVPVNKTGTAFSKPIDSVVGRSVELWEQMRPPQPSSLDLKTGEQVHRLFSHRGRGISNHYINKVVIPLLCRKAAVPLDDARGRITSHRARATIASQLYNAKEPLSLFELQEWLGHSSPESTRHYTKITPTKLAKSYQDAGYFARNLRAVEVLIDQDVVRRGSPLAEPWKLYDLGHGYCSYDFFDQCPHRMACARCDFYVPKESSKAQSIEAKANLLRLRQEIPLSEDELRAVEDGIAGHEKLVAKLVSCPTPAFK